MDLAKINDILVDLFVPILILISALILGKIFERLSLKIAEELELEKITKFPNERISVIVKYLTYLAGTNSINIFHNIIDIHSNIFSNIIRFRIILPNS